ncbi:UNVERIFIED_CONTAM: hypothetical protein HDU68_003796 [Siphonaria sp. JEL0065]|nr:hypothetical protein HDU68_003796 [Siphonaria sp. JEL0065]
MDYSGYEAYAKTYAAAGHGTLTHEDYYKLWIAAQQQPVASVPKAAPPPPASYVQAYYSSSSANSGIPVGLTKEEIVVYKEAQKKAWNEYFATAKSMIKNPFAEAAGPKEEKPVKPLVIYDPVKAKKEAAAAAAAVSSTTSVATSSSSDITNTKKPPPPPPPKAATASSTLESLSNSQQNIPQPPPAPQTNATQSEPSTETSIPAPPPQPPNDVQQNDQQEPTKPEIPQPSPEQSHQQQYTQLQHEQSQSDPQQQSQSQQGSNKLKILLKPSTETKLRVPVNLSKDQEILAQYDTRIEAEERALQAFLVEQEKIRERVAKAIETRTRQCEQRVQALKEARDLEKERQDMRRVKEEEELRKRLKEEEELERLEKVRREREDAENEWRDEQDRQHAQQQQQSEQQQQQQPQQRMNSVGSAPAAVVAVLSDDFQTPSPAPPVVRRTVGGRESGPALFLPPPSEPEPEPERKSKRRRSSRSGDRQHREERRHRRRERSSRHDREDSPPPHGYRDNRPREPPLSTPVGYGDDRRREYSPSDRVREASPRSIEYRDMPPYEQDRASRDFAHNNHERPRHRDEEIPRAAFYEPREERQRHIDPREQRQYDPREVHYDRRERGFNPMHDYRGNFQQPPPPPPPPGHYSREQSISPVSRGDHYSVPPPPPPPPPPGYSNDASVFERKLLPSESDLSVDGPGNSRIEGEINCIQEVGGDAGDDVEITSRNSGSSDKRRHKSSRHGHRSHRNKRSHSSRYEGEGESYYDEYDRNVGRDFGGEATTHFKTIFSSVLHGNSFLPSFGRGSNKKEQKFLADPNGPPIPLRSDGRRKRVHPTREQQTMLEAFFQQCYKPSSKQRADICKKVNINARSVQIWFQNRRARMKRDGEIPNSGSLTLDSKSDSSDEEDVDQDSSCPPSEHKQPQAITDSTTNISATTTSINSASASTIFSTPPLQHQQQQPELWTTAQGSTRILASELNVGTWRRVATTMQDLICEVSTFQGVIRYAIVEAGYTFKLELNLSAIIDVSIHPFISNSAMSSIALDVGGSPMFYRELRDAQGGITGLFAACEDFTEQKQASSCTRHVLHGSTIEMERLEHLFMISIAAGGASFPAPAYLAAISAFQDQYPTAPQVVYATSNSGTGQTGVHSGIYEWGGSDIGLNPAIISGTPVSNASLLVALPAIGGGLLISYNVPGLQTLKLSRKVLPRIFDGTIRVWNHPLLVSDNPALKEVDQPMMVVRRSPGSGSTVNLVEGLKSMDISMGFTESPFLKDGTSLSLNNSILVGTNGAAGTIVGNYPYTLTYMSQYEYIQEHMAEASSNCYVATLQHIDGAFIDWNAQSLGTAMKPLQRANSPIQTNMHQQLQQQTATKSNKQNKTAEAQNILSGAYLSEVAENNQGRVAAHVFQVGFKRKRMIDLWTPATLLVIGSINSVFLMTTTFHMFIQLANAKMKLPDEIQGEIQQQPNTVSSNMRGTVEMQIGGDSFYLEFENREKLDQFLTFHCSAQVSAALEHRDEFGGFVIGGFK